MGVYNGFMIVLMLCVRTMPEKTQSLAPILPWYYVQNGDRNYFEIWCLPKIGETQYRPKNTIVLIMGTPKRVPLISGNPHLLPQSRLMKAPLAVVHPETNTAIFSGREDAIARYSGIHGGPKPQTVNPGLKPQTLTPKLQTLNPEPQDSGSKSL